VGLYFLTRILCAKSEMISDQKRKIWWRRFKATSCFRPISVQNCYFSIDSALLPLPVTNHFRFRCK